jgi:hypothetical protein
LWYSGGNENLQKKKAPQKVCHFSFFCFLTPSNPCLAFFISHTVVISCFSF